MLAAAHINDMWPDSEPRFMQGKEHLLCQLKHPDEIYWLRKIYGSTFHLVGVYCPVLMRIQNLMNQGMTNEQADELIRRDDEEDPFG